MIPLDRKAVCLHKTVQSKVLEGLTGSLQTAQVKEEVESVAELEKHRH